MAGATPIRIPFLIAALVIAFMITGLETGTSVPALGGCIDGFAGNARDAFKSVAKGIKPSEADPNIKGLRGLETALGKSPQETRSMSSAALSSLDFLVFVTLLFFTLPLVVKPGLVSKIQGPAFVITSFVMFFGALVVIMKAIVSLMVMITLLLAIPFGTIVYMVVYASFDVSKPAMLLHSLFTLKIMCFACVVIASEFFVANLGFVLLAASTLVVQVAINFLYGLPPRFLVSITDAIGAILVGVVAIVWAIIMGIAGFVAILKTITKLRLPLPKS